MQVGISNNDQYHDYMDIFVLRKRYGRTLFQRIYTCIYTWMQPKSIEGSAIKLLLRQIEITAITNVLGHNDIKNHE